MATTAATTKATRVAKPDFVFSGKVGKRTINGKRPKSGEVFSYVETTLKETTNVAEALSTLKVKDGPKAVKMLLVGFNRAAKQGDSARLKIARSIAESEGISVEDAYKRAFPNG